MKILLLFITVKNVMQILPLAHEYQMDAIVDVCENLLIQIAGARQRGSLELLVIAEKYGLKNLRQRCINRAKEQKLSDLEKNVRYKQVSADSKVEILQFHARRQLQATRRRNDRIWRILNCGFCRAKQRH